MKLILRMFLYFLIVSVSSAVQAKPSNDNEPIYVYPDITNEIRLSNMDINLVRCHKPIQDRNYSGAKPITIKVQGKFAFVEFQSGHAMQPGAEGSKPMVDYNATRKLFGKRTEIYFLCDNQIYKILARPRSITARTVILSRGKETDISQNIKRLSRQSEEEYLQTLIKEVLLNEIPEGYEISRQSNWYHVYKNLNIQLKRKIHPSGTGFRVLEFTIKNAAKNLQLSEADFHRPEFSKSPVAIILDPLVLGQGEEGRLLIVETINQPSSGSLFKGKHD